jgi:hypothetical protein
MFKIQFLCKIGWARGEIPMQSYGSECNKWISSLVSVSLWSSQDKSVLKPVLFRYSPCSFYCQALVLVTLSTNHASRICCSILITTWGSHASCRASTSSRNTIRQHDVSSYGVTMAKYIRTWWWMTQAWVTPGGRSAFFSCFGCWTTTWASRR